jgi:pSer/pThr/pTyr-binding forkhead associated (FHA) protein
MTLRPGLQNCPKCRRQLPEDEGAAELPVEGTRLESVEEIRRAIKGKKAVTLKESPADVETVTFRPLRRPPMALVCVLDDGKEEGEWVRLRDDRLVIGREEGDIRIPHDDMMSARHAELVRQAERGRYRWYLVDCQSTNGTYVRIGKAILRHGQEFLIGSGRYRFDAAVPGAAQLAEEPQPDETRPKGTRGWEMISPADVLPSLVHLTPQGEGERFVLSKTDNWLGRDPVQCTVVLSKDPLVNPRHARLHRDTRGRWQLENASSLNGTWLRVNKIALDDAGQFQLGEQRFLVRIL